MPSEVLDESAEVSRREAKRGVAALPAAVHAVRAGQDPRGAHASIEQMLLDGLTAHRSGASLSGVTISGHGPSGSSSYGPGGGKYDPEAIYWAAIRQVFYDAWDQPNDADAGNAARIEASSGRP